MFNTYEEARKNWRTNFFKHKIVGVILTKNGIFIIAKNFEQYNCYTNHGWKSC